MNLLKYAKQLFTIAVAVVSIVSMLVIPGCNLPPFPSPPEDDAGDESFVRQVVPALLGRKVRGYDELKALTNIIQVTDRETVVRALMEEEEFRNYWAEALVDHLRIHREGTKSQFACYGGPLLAGPPSEALADFVMNSPPSTDFGSEFNMSDLVYSSIKKDNLFPIYKAHIFALANRPGAFFGDQAELQRRADLGGSFEHIYLNRQLLCLECHNSESSTSGEDSGWDRTHPVPGHFEAAIYGSSSGTSPEQAFAIFRTDVRGGSLRPWGIQSSCGTFKPSVEKDTENFTAWFTGPLGRQVTVRNLVEILQFGYNELDANGLDRSLPVAQQEQCEFCTTSCEGVGIAEDAPLEAVNAAAVKTILLDKCENCHREGAAGGDGFDIPTDNTWFTDLVNVDAVTAPEGGNQTRVVPGMASMSYLINKLEGTNIGGSQMPLNAPELSPEEIDTIKNWINDIPSGAACNVCDTLDCNPAFPQRVQGHEAVAFLLAQRIVNNVWEQVMGYPLTIANYFPRTESQLNALWNLTEYTFIPSDWSLKELLVKIVTSNLFNRNAPRFGTGTTPYNVDMLYDPWVEADPRVSPVSDPGYDPNTNPEVHNNAMSDGVYRYTAHNLLNSIHRALDWPEPQRFPSLGNYPDAPLERAMGQFFSDAEAGSKTSDFQALLHWESVHGVCNKTGITGSDWIDAVMLEVAGFSGSGGPLTVEDVAVLLRDWLLSDGTIGSTAPDGLTASEAQALADYFGVSLNTDASVVPDLETKLRGFCGALVETPQFWLAGIAPTGLGPEPRLRVCTSGACSHQEICDALKPAVDTLISPDTLICGSDDINVFSVRVPSDIDALCPSDLCRVVPKKADHVIACLANPTNCPGTPPLCDPRCSRIDCCGGPLPPIDRQGLLVSWADGAITESVVGVKILRPGAHRFVELERGDVLREGDLLAIRPGNDLRLKTKKGVFETTGNNLQKEKTVTPRLMMITGKRALLAREPGLRDQVQKIDRKELARKYELMINEHKKGVWRWGEAGRPLTTKQRRGYVGPEEEIFKKLMKQKKQQEQGQSQSSPE